MLVFLGVLSPLTLSTISVFLSTFAILARSAIVNTGHAVRGWCGRKRLTVTAAERDLLLLRWVKTTASDDKTAETKNKAYKCFFIFYLFTQPLRSTCYEILWQFGLFGNLLRTF